MKLFKRLICYFNGHKWDELYFWATHSYTAKACVHCGKQDHKIRILND